MIADLTRVKVCLIASDIWSDRLSAAAGWSAGANIYYGILGSRLGKGTGMVLDTYVSQPGKEYFRSAIGTVSIYIEEGTRDTQLIMMCVACQPWSTLG